VSIFGEFEGNDRFALPSYLVRATAGHGGESVLIFGSEKTALYDCGMAYCGEGLIRNIKKALAGRPLDVVLLSHTHYDHVGALAQVLKCWPDAVVYGAGHGRDILKRPGALRVIRDMSIQAAMDFGGGRIEGITTDGMRIDEIMDDGDSISLGDKRITAMTARGHTDCSMIYTIEPDGFMFASESTGVLVHKDFVQPAILKSYDDAMATADKCMAAAPETIFVPHYGVIPHDYNNRYIEVFREAAAREREFVTGLWKRGFSRTEIFSRFCDEYMVAEAQTEQPAKAFAVNARATIALYTKED